MPWVSFSLVTVELPPRARRIPADCGGGADWRGTTSACAENTFFTSSNICLTWNYLRVRGEYPCFPHQSCHHLELPPRARRIRQRRARRAARRELPPRARRIPLLASRAASASGTTSACAENTDNNASAWRTPWNYLRVRGEYAMDKARLVEELELPPRARRIHMITKGNELTQGTTSACAENTPLAHSG